MIVLARDLFVLPGVAGFYFNFVNAVMEICYEIALLGLRVKLKITQVIQDFMRFAKSSTSTGY